MTFIGIYTIVTHHMVRAPGGAACLVHQCQARQSSRNKTRFAVHLLRAGVDINTIRAWLGDVSTTMIYTHANPTEKEFRTAPFFTSLLGRRESVDKLREVIERVHVGRFRVLGCRIVAWAGMPHAKADQASLGVDH